MERSYCSCPIAQLCDYTVQLQLGRFITAKIQQFYVPITFKKIIIVMIISRVWARSCHCVNPARQLKLSLKKKAKGTICPLQNLGKKLELKHTQRDLVQYRNCKLKQNMESIFYRTFKVHSRVTFQSRSTEHVTYVSCSTKRGELQHSLRTGVIPWAKRVGVGA